MKIEKQLEKISRQYNTTIRQVTKADFKIWSNAKMTRRITQPDFIFELCNEKVYIIEKTSATGGSCIGVSDSPSFELLEMIG